METNQPEEKERVAAQESELAPEATAAKTETPVHLEGTESVEKAGGAKRKTPAIEEPVAHLVKFGAGF